MKKTDYMNRFVKAIFVVFMVLTTIALGSCVSDVREGGNGHKKPEVDADMEMITLRLRVPDASQHGATTRALNEAEECDVDNVDLLLFFPDSDLYAGRYTGSNINVNNIGVTGPAGATVDFQVTMPAGEWDVMVLANSDAILDAASLAHDGSMDRNEVADALTTAMDTGGWISTRGTAGYRPMPMWGYCRDVNIGAEEIDAINMTRMLAKVNITMNPELSNDVFRLQEVRVYNYSESGRLIPALNTEAQANYWANVSATNLDDNETPSLPTGLTIANYPVTGNPGEFIRRTSTDSRSVVNDIYLFEATAGVPTSSNNFEQNVCLVIGGRFGAFDTSWYRIDFTADRADADEYLPLLRNNSYTININDVDAPGSPTPEEALRNPNHSMNASVVSWNNSDFDIILHQGIAYIGLQNTNEGVLNFQAAAGEEQTLTIRTNIRDFVLTLETDNTRTLSAAGLFGDSALSRSLETDNFRYELKWAGDDIYTITATTLRANVSAQPNNITDDWNLKAGGIDNIKLHMIQGWDDFYISVIDEESTRFFPEGGEIRLVVISPEPFTITPDGSWPGWITDTGSIPSGNIRGADGFYSIDHTLGIAPSVFNAAAGDPREQDPRRQRFTIRAASREVNHTIVQEYPYLIIQPSGEVRVPRRSNEVSSKTIQVSTNLLAEDWILLRDADMQGRDEQRPNADRITAGAIHSSFNKQNPRYMSFTVDMDFTFNAGQVEPRGAFSALFTVHPVDEHYDLPDQELELRVAPADALMGVMWRGASFGQDRLWEVTEADSNTNDWIFPWNTERIDFDINTTAMFYLHTNADANFMVFPRMDQTGGEIVVKDPITGIDTYSMYFEFNNLDPSAAGSHTLNFRTNDPEDPTALVATTSLPFRYGRQSLTTVPAGTIEVPHTGAAQNQDNRLNIAGNIQWTANFRDWTPGAGTNWASLRFGNAVYDQAQKSGDGRVFTPAVGPDPNGNALYATEGALITDQQLLYAVNQITDQINHNANNYREVTISLGNGVSGIDPADVVLRQWMPTLRYTGAAEHNIGVGGGSVSIPVLTNLSNWSVLLRNVDNGSEGNKNVSTAWAGGAISNLQPGARSLDVSVDPNTRTTERDIDVLLVSPAPAFTSAVVATIKQSGVARFAITTNVNEPSATTGSVAVNGDALNAYGDTNENTQARPGATVLLTAPAATNAAYQFTGWTIVNTDNGGSAVAFTADNGARTARFTMPGGRVSATANYTAISRRISMIVQDEATQTPQPTWGSILATKNNIAFTEGIVGDNINLDAEPATGYEFVRWVGFTNATWTPGYEDRFTSPQAKITLTGTGDVVATASFRATTYAITGRKNIDAAANGNITVSGVQTIGQTITVTAPAPIAGYSWTGWTTSTPVTWTGGTNATTRTSARFLMPAQAMTITANYALNTANLTTSANPAAGGYVSPSSGTITTGNTIRATANVGYVFNNWTNISGGTLSATNIAAPTVTVTGATLSVQANFTGRDHNIIKAAAYSDNFNVLEGVGLSGNQVTTAKTGGFISLRHHTNPAGHTFARWSVSGPATLNTGLGITMAWTDQQLTLDIGPGPNGNDAVTVTPQYTVNTYTATPGANVSFSNGSTAATQFSYGTTVGISAANRAGYTFRDWTVTPAVTWTAGTSMTTQTNARFTMPASNVTIAANYNAVEYTVTGIKGLGAGIADIAVSGTRTVGQTITVTAPAPAAGYTFSGWTTTTTGVSFANSTAASTTFTMPASNVSITANYRAVEYVVTANKGEGAGTDNVTVSGTRTVGQTITVTAPGAATGYTFDRWTTSTAGVSFTNSAAVSTTFTMPASAVQVTATYKKIEYNITETSTNGSVTAPGITFGTSKVTVDQAITITATPDANYEFTGWTISGARYNLRNTYPLVAYTATDNPATIGVLGGQDVSITANFARKKHTVTLGDGAHLSLTYGGSYLSQTAAEKEVANTVYIALENRVGYTVSVSPSVTLANLSYNGDVTISGTSYKMYSFTMPDSDVTVSAAYTGEAHTLNRGYQLRDMATDTRYGTFRTYRRSGSNYSATAFTTGTVTTEEVIKLEAFPYHPGTVDHYTVEWKLTNATFVNSTGGTAPYNASTQNPTYIKVNGVAGSQPVTVTADFTPVPGASEPGVTRPAGGVVAPPGILGVGAETGLLTIRGSKEYSANATLLNYANTIIGGLAEETVYIVYFKWGSLIGTWGANGDYWNGLNDVAWSAVGSNVATDEHPNGFLSSITTWGSFLPATGGWYGAGYPSRAIGDPCRHANKGTFPNDLNTPTGNLGYWNGYTQISTANMPVTTAIPGVSGRYMGFNINGLPYSSFFFPYAGFRRNDTGAMQNQGIWGDYWTRTANSSVNPAVDAYVLNFSNAQVNSTSTDINYAFPIRCV